MADNVDEESTSSLKNVQLILPNGKKAVVNVDVPTYRKICQGDRCDDTIKRLVRQLTNSEMEATVVTEELNQETDSISSIEHVEQNTDMATEPLEHDNTCYRATESMEQNNTCYRAMESMEQNTDSMEQNLEMTYNTRHEWTDAEIKHLIRLIKDNLDRLKTARNKNPIWKKIGQNLHISPDKCLDKFKYLKKAYRNYVQLNNRTDGTPTKFSYSEQMSDLMGNDPLCNISSDTQTGEEHCEYCYKGYKNRRSLLKHIKHLQHFPCYCCGVQNKDKPSLIQHLMECPLAPWVRKENRERAESGETKPLRKRPKLEAPVQIVESESHLSEESSEDKDLVSTLIGPTNLIKVIKTGTRSSASPRKPFHYNNLIITPIVPVQKFVPSISNSSLMPCESVSVETPNSVFPTIQTDVTSLRKSATPSLRTASRLDHFDCTSSDTSTQTDSGTCTWSHVHSIITTETKDGTKRREEIIQSQSASECVFCQDKKGDHF